MKSFVVATLLAVVAFSHAETENNFESLWGHAFDATPAENLLQAVESLKTASSPQAALHGHAARIADHAALIAKAKAYKHSFAARNAIKAAVKQLHSEMRNGHNHDKNALNQARSTGQRAINNANSKGKRVVAGYRAKACPTKKAQEQTLAKKNAAKQGMDSIKRGRVCNIGTTWADMAISKRTPTFGSELQGAWNRARSNWVRKRNQYNAAVKAYNKAAREHSAAMAAFKSTLRVEASNANSACRNAHREYEVLKRDVRSNVSTRKQVYIASLVITCIVDNLTNSRSAKACAQRAQRSNTNMWNITPPRLAKCSSTVVLQAQFGPANWRPSKRNCHASHWNERDIKAAKKRGARLYCHTRKVSSNHAGVIRVTQQGGYTLTGGGVNNRYRHWNAKSGFEESYPETNGQWRCDMGFGAGQLDCYSRSCRTNVGNLSCRRWARSKRGSGAMQVNVGAGYTLTSCGLFNHYRGWNARAGFEEYFPNGNGCHGDMGFGWGHFTVYAMGCKAPAGHRLTCTTRRSGRGNYHVVGCPGGYTMTGCGIRNNYRGWNAKAGVEDTGVPHGNGCRCDTGFGTGDNYCYARCCKLN